MIKKEYKLIKEERMFTQSLLQPLLLALLGITTARASVACVTAPCSDIDALLQEGTCLSRCGCIWDSVRKKFIFSLFFH
jgi:hypothetical protein